MEIKQLLLEMLAHIDRLENKLNTEGWEPGDMELFNSLCDSLRLITNALSSASPKEYLDFLRKI